MPIMRKILKFKKSFYRTLFFSSPFHHVKYLFCIMILTILPTALGQDQISVKTGTNFLINRTVCPDQSICIINDSPLRFTVANPPGTVLMEGSTFENARIIRTLINPSKKAGEYDEQYAGIGGCIRVGGSMIAAFHAEKPTGGYTKFNTPRGYASVCLAISEDNGFSFQKIGPIITGRPLDPDWKGAIQGNGDPTLCIDETGTWIYCYYTEHSRLDPETGRNRSVITCMARSAVKDRGLPGTWRKYYRGNFSEPGLGGKDTEVVDLWAPHVQYIQELKKYVMVGSRGGINLHHSDDGIHWSRPITLTIGDDLPVGEYAWHPCLSLTERRTDVVSGLLLYGYSSDGRISPFMHGRKISLSNESNTIENEKTTTNSADSFAKAPKPLLYLSGDFAKQQVSGNLSFKRMEGTFVDGKIGKGVYFDGNQFSEIECKLPLGKNPRTIALWIKNDRGPVNQGVHIVTQGPVEQAKPFGIMEAGTKWRFFDLNGGLDSGIIVDKKWHHHTVTYDGKIIRYYLDGKEVGKSEKQLSTANGTLKIGGLGDRSNNFVGAIDELYVFDVALSEGQVRKLYNLR